MRGGCPNVPQPSYMVTGCVLCSYPSGYDLCCTCTRDCGDEICARAPLPEITYVPPPVPVFRA